MSATLDESILVLPTEDNLSELLVKLLAIFELDSTPETRALPVYPLQREVKDLTTTHHHLILPISGNDFHALHSSLNLAWEALLQLQDASGNTLCIPFCRIDYETQPEQQVANTAFVAALKSSWPDASVNLSRQNHLGAQDLQRDTANYSLYRWLKSKKLNSTAEFVTLKNMFRSGGQLREALRPPWFASKNKIEAPASEPEHCQATSADAQVWSFTGSFTATDNWTISLPVFATILLLMSNPLKKSKAQSDCPDRDLSWCLDSLHGFCRLKGPSEGGRNLSWAMGTFPDCWMYLHFIFHYFSPGYEESHSNEPEKWKGSGLRCERRKIALPIGRDNAMVPFQEERVWFGMRTATAYKDDEKYKGHESTSLSILADWAHFPFDVKPKSWQKSGLESPEAASGVALFQMLLRDGIDFWEYNWRLCLDHVDRLHELKTEDLDGPALSEFMFDPSGSLAKAYFLTAHLLKTFSKHIDIMPRTLESMRRVWERTYPALESDLVERFDEATQAALLRNWDNVIAHANNSHSKLIQRVEKKTRDLMSLRDSLLIATSVRT